MVCLCSAWLLRSLSLATLALRSATIICPHGSAPFAFSARDKNNWLAWGLLFTAAVCVQLVFMCRKALPSYALSARDINISLCGAMHEHSCVHL